MFIYIVTMYYEILKRNKPTFLVTMELTVDLHFFQAETVENVKNQHRQEEYYADSSDTARNGESREYRDSYGDRSHGTETTDNNTYNNFRKGFDCSVDYGHNSNMGGGFDQRIKAEEVFDVTTQGRMREDRLRQDRSSGSPFNRGRQNRR